MGDHRGDAAFDAWAHSPGHHRNLVGAGANTQGVGVSQEHWTQMFG